MSRFASGLVVVIVALGAAACGTTPGADLQALTTQLEAVDAAAVADDDEQLESAVGGLLRAVDEAEAAGDVSSAHADRIRKAAEALLEAAAPAEPKEPKEPKEPTSTPPPDEDHEDDGEDGDDDDESRPGPGGPPGGHKNKPKGHDKDD